MLGIENLNQHAAETLDEIAAQVESAVNQAVFALRFQDVLTQLLGPVGHWFDVQDGVVGD